MGVIEIKYDESVIGQMCDDVFGEGWGLFWIVYLSIGDGIGIELFEFLNMKQEENLFEYWWFGLFYFCFQDEDLEGWVKVIESLGG